MYEPDPPGGIATQSTDGIDLAKLAAWLSDPDFPECAKSALRELCADAFLRAYADAENWRVKCEQARQRRDQFIEMVEEKRRLFAIAVGYDQAEIELRACSKGFHFRTWDGDHFSDWVDTLDGAVQGSPKWRERMAPADPDPDLDVDVLTVPGLDANTVVTAATR